MNFLFPSNLNVSVDFASGNIEILGKQNSLFPSGPVIKCLLLYSCNQSLYELNWSFNLTSLCPYPRIFNPCLETETSVFVIRFFFLSLQSKKYNWCQLFCFAFNLLFKIIKEPTTSPPCVFTLSARDFHEVRGLGKLMRGDHVLN